MTTKLMTSIFGLTLLFGCSTPKKADLDSSNPKAAVQDIQNLQEQLVYSNADILAHKAYAKGTKDLNRAVDKFKKNRPKEEVMSRLAQAKAHFLDAKVNASNREITPSRVLTARNSAVKAGAHQLLRKNLESIDESFIDETDKFSKDLSVSKLSELQNKYLNLEGLAVQSEKLGAFRVIIKKAKKDDASDLAPNTFKDARSDVKLAENLIGHSPRNPRQYSESVEKANKSAKLLSDVMMKLQGEAKGSSENVALKLVNQERKLGKLSDKVQILKGSLGESQVALGAASQSILSKNAEIMSAKSRIKFQRAMNQVRKSFNEDEASVYQQGKELIIRLKKINFVSGRATIPTDAMTLLSKVSAIVTEVEPREIVIQGHTDSMGKESYNMALSGKRADAVKTYFSSLNVGYVVAARGFGESKPIANNQTKNGRSLNRRVDIVVKAAE